MSLDIKLPRLSIKSFKKKQSSSQSLRSSDRSEKLQEEDRYSIPNNQPSQSSDSRTRRIGRRLKMGFPTRQSLHPRVMRERFQPEGTSGMLLLGYALSSLLAIIIPLSKWATERGQYYKYYGQYNAYEQQQQQYNNNGQNNGNWNGGNYYNLCSWWDFKCRYQMRRYSQQYGNYNNNNNNGGQDQEQAQSKCF